MDKFCHSCAAPLNSDFKGKAENYCKYCADEKGQLKSRQEVQQNIAWWLKTWQPHIDDAKATARAADYMKAMPAWAN
jgi:Putative zinc ribbon domain